MAVHWARSNLEIDPLNEELNFRLMNWLNEAGRRSDAIHQYNLFCKRFKRENLTPSPAIEQLYQKIQSQLLERLPETHVSWPVSLNLQYPLVGQSRAIQDLRLAFRRGQTAVLLGEAGSGKTRLAYELYHTLDPSPRLLYSTARPLETRLPFQPLIDMLRHSVRPEEWSALAPVWSAALARILPELALDSDVRRFQPLEDRPILLEAILNILQIVARSQRVLFVLDDAHWCDEDTLEAVAYLIGRNFFLNHGLLLITARPEEKNPALQTLLDTVQYSYSLTRITLEPLSIEEIAQLSQFVVGRPVPADLVARLARESLGSPLFLLENLRALMDAYPDLSKLAGQESLPVPESIHAILHQRVALLSANATQVLTAAAILAEPFPPGLIEEVTSLGPDVVALALEELEDARLLAPVTDPAYGAAYTIQHNSLRNAFVLTLSLARQRIYHLRVARALERRCASPTPVLAQHLEAGGELQRAFERRIHGPNPWPCGGVEVVAVTEIEQQRPRFAQQLVHACRTFRRSYVHVGHAPSEQWVSFAEVVVDVEPGQHRCEAPARLVHAQQLCDVVAQRLMPVVGRAERDLRHDLSEDSRGDRMALGVVRVEQGVG
jgi:energy-coupling factor transporter ATP-binding protein EcfA2